MDLLTVQEIKLHVLHPAAVDMEEAVVRQDHMVDKKIVKAPKISQDRLRDMGLEWFYGTSEWDYLSEDLLVLSEAEVGLNKSFSCRFNNFRDNSDWNSIDFVVVPFCPNCFGLGSATQHPTF